MERRVEELLVTLHSLVFTDADSIISEIRGLVLNQNLSGPQIAFFSSKLLNSEVSLLQFIKQNRLDSDRLIWKTMSNALELVSDYIKERGLGISEYIIEIKEICLQLMAPSTKSSMVKEAALRPLIKLLEVFTANKLKHSFDPNELFNVLLDNKLKFEEKTMGSTLKGAIFNMLGLLISHFEMELADRIPEVQKLMIVKLKEEVNKRAKTEEKALAGILKGMASALRTFNYEEKELGEIFEYVKAFLKPLVQGRYGVSKASLKVLSENSAIFKKYITENAIEIVRTLLDLNQQTNSSYKYLAQETTGHCLGVLSESLSELQRNDVFEYILKILNSQINSKNPEVLNTTIRYIGVYSPAIVKFKGEQYLTNLLNTIIELSSSLFNEEDDESFKAMVLRQKKLTSLLISYSDIARSLSDIPESILLHFTEIGVEIFRKNSMIYKKYRKKVYNSIALLFAAIYTHGDVFVSWIRVFIYKSMKELLSVSGDFNGSRSRIELASKLWLGIFEQDCLTENALLILSEEIGRFYHQLIISLDLNYSIENNKLEANNPEDQQLFYEASEFAEIFLPKIGKRLEIWVTPFLSALAERISDLPLLPSLYMLSKVTLQICSISNYCEKNIESKKYILNFVSHIIKKMQGFQDALLNSCIEVCLAVPTCVVYSERNNLHLFEPVILQGLSLGLSHLPLAHTVISMLNNWTKDIPMQALEEILPRILPALSSYLTLDKINQEMQAEVERQKKKTIAFRVVKFLGSLGGAAHYLVNPKHSEIYLAWDSQSRINFPISLGTQKLEIQLDDILPRLIYLTEQSNEKKIKIAACELLHALLTYMLGKSTLVQVPFEKIYIHMFPVVYRLATDLEIITRQLFEPLSKQLVRWFAKSSSYEQPETMALLDSLIECVCNPENSALRNLASDCLGEFCKYVILYNSTILSNFKSLVRKVSALSNHPQVHKRRAAILCFKKILPQISLNEALLDKFLLELAHMIFITTKLLHLDKSSSEILEICYSLLTELKQIIIDKVDILKNNNNKRSYHKNIFEFLDWLWEYCRRPERVCREFAQDYWKSLAVVCKLDVRKFLIGKNKGMVYENEFGCLEGLLDFALWSSGCGITQCDENEIQRLINEFLAKDKKDDEETVENIRTLLAVIKYSVYFPNRNINEEYILRFIINPKSIGYYQEVDTQEFNLIYEETSHKMIEIIRQFGINPNSFTKIWQELALDSEKVLKTSLNGFLRLIRNDEILKTASFPMVKEKLNRLMIQFYNSDNINHHRKAKIILEFFKKTELDPDVLSRILKNQKLMRLCSESIYEYISLNMQATFSVFLNSLASKPSQLLGMMVPLLEKCSALIKSKFLDLRIFVNTFLIEIIPITENIIALNKTDFSLGVIRIYCIFLEFTQDLTVFGEGVKEIKESPQFYKHLVFVLKSFLLEEQPLMLKKETFRLVSVSWHYFDVKLFSEIKNLLLQMQHTYFLPSTTSLPQSKETIDFETTVKGFFELFLRVPHRAILELLYPLIREEKSGYEQELKYLINQYIHKLLEGPFEQSFAQMLDQFFDMNLDNGISDNIRWGIASRIIIPMLNICDENLLETLMISHTPLLLQKITEIRFTEIYDSKEFLFRLREKTWILLFFETFFKRILSTRIKEHIHKNLYGPNSQGNELTKQIISYCSKYRKERPEKYEMIDAFSNSQECIRQFCCANYACLLTCIRKTQSQEKIFVNFLFRDQNWKVLIEEKEDFGFTPQTVFARKEKPVELEKSEKKISSAYIVGSLFSQDIALIRTSEPKLIEIPEEKIEVELEQDIINSHIIMKPLLEVIEKMSGSFPEGLEMSQWMQCLHGDLCNSSNYLAIKLFIIKVILNKPLIFARWANLWISPIAQVMSGPNGGIGFHYFIRDVSTLFLYDWENANVLGKERDLSKFVNYLVKVGADTNKNILDSNLSIISGLIKKWKMPLEHRYIDGMIKKQINDQDSKVGIAWKITGIILYGVALDEKVKILQENRENYESLDEGLLKCLEVNRKHIVLAAAEVIGKRMSMNENFFTDFSQALSKKEIKDIGSYVNILEKIAISYPKILDNKNICFKLSAYFGKLSGATRASLLKMILSYSEYVKTCTSFYNIPEISEYLFRDREKIANDNEDSHRLSLLKLLYSLVDLIANPSVKKAVSGYIPLLKSFTTSPNSEIRQHLYMVMRKAYDESKNLEEPLRVRSRAREILLKGLSDSDHSQEIMNFWNHQDRLSLEPSLRMLQCLSEIYTPECEELWLVASSHLLLKLTEHSTDFEKFLFEHPLAHCNFNNLQVKTDDFCSLPMTPMFSPSYYHQDSLQKASQKSSEFVQPIKPSRIRHLVEGSQASIEENREKIRKTQQERLQQRLIEQKSKQINVIRNYRNGELPDIQIKTSDILLPLSNLILLDCQIASNIWVCICTNIFSHLDLDLRKKIIKSLNRILEISEGYNSEVINCVHRITRELVRRNGEFAKEINAGHVSTSGIRSMCYQSAIMLIQECLLRFENSDFESTPALSGCEKPLVTKNTRAFWIGLSKIYEKMGDSDSVKGIWMLIINEDASELGVKIKRAFDYKTKGALKQAGNCLSEILNESDGDLASEIKSEYLEAMAYLGKWAEVKTNADEASALKIKAFMRLNEFEELSEFVKLLPPASLYTRFPYEMSLLNITQDDPDRAKYYLDQEFSRFVEKWQSLNPLSFSARHKLIQKLQKIFELSEFLSVYGLKKDETQEEYSDRVENIFRHWKARLPSMAMDSVAVWEEILFARVLYYDKIQSGNLFHSENLTEFTSGLYAQTAEFPLKLGWLEVSERFLREALNRREDKNTTKMNVYSPVIRLRAKKLVEGSQVLQVNEIVAGFDHIINNLNIQATRCPETDAVDLAYGQIYKYLAKCLLSKPQSLNNSLPKTSKLAYNYLGKGAGSTSSLKFAHFCDLILRNYEENPSKLVNTLTEMQVSPQILAENIIVCTIRAMNSNNQRAHDMFPRLIELLSYSEVLGTFKSELKHLPEWMLIRWIGQILAIFDKPECDVFSEIVYKLVTTYPQVFYYPYKAYCSVDSFTQFLKVNSETKSLTWKIVEEVMQKFGFLDKFADSLEMLTNPEHRFKSFTDLIKDAYSQGTSKEYLNYLSQEFYKNVVQGFNPGVYNKKFASDWEPQLIKCFGPKFIGISNMIGEEFCKVLEDINKKMQNNTLPSREKLNTFSEWLADYSMDTYSNEVIQIPGTFSGLMQPLKSSEVNIVSFDQSLLILSSIRKPKKLGIHGSDEKEYFVLVKGGEDIRLDQRIQQIFGVMNRIFSSDPECMKLSIKLKTFNIVPITKRLGILEWINNTEPLKSIIDNELFKYYSIKDINSTDASRQRLSWLSSLAPNSANNRFQQHLVALMADRQTILDNFVRHERKIPWDLIRQGLLSISTTPESFMHLRKQFILSLAVISVAGYIIGLGDRHLENFLLDKSDGGLLAIDFGVAFGSGINLAVPELMPFRMTRQFISLLAPEGVKGELRHTMIHCLKALRKYQSIILDCCRVFVNEPLQEWTKSNGKHSEMAKKKIEIVKKKLSGANSAQIMLDELEDTRHESQNYAANLVDIVMGPQGCLRRKLPMHGLGPDQQVDVLLEHATDSNILGRTWIGWNPMI